MEDYTAVLLHTPLFSGFSAPELEQLLAALSPVYRQYQKGEILLLAGHAPASLGVVLEGRARAVKTSPAGAESIAARLSPGGVYGDVLAAGCVASPVTVVAATGCRVMLVSASRIFEAGAQGELCRRLLANLLRVLSEKYFSLDARVDILAIPGLRRRVAAWLLQEAPHGQSTVTPGLTRAQLAAHLGCERAALCRILSQMAADGLLTYDRKHFHIPDRTALTALL